MLGIYNRILREQNPNLLISGIRYFIENNSQPNLDDQTNLNIRKQFWFHIILVYFEELIVSDFVFIEYILQYIKNTFNDTYLLYCLFTKMKIFLKTVITNDIGMYSNLIRIIESLIECKLLKCSIYTILRIDFLYNFENYDKDLNHTQNVVYKILRGTDFAKEDIKNIDIKLFIYYCSIFRWIIPFRTILDAKLINFDDESKCNYIPVEEIIYSSCSLQFKIDFVENYGNLHPYVNLYNYLTYIYNESLYLYYVKVPTHIIVTNKFNFRYFINNENRNYFEKSNDDKKLLINFMYSNCFIPLPILGIIVDYLAGCFYPELYT